MYKETSTGYLLTHNTCLFFTGMEGIKSFFSWMQVCFVHINLKGTIMASNQRLAENEQDFVLFSYIATGGIYIYIYAFYSSEWV